MGGTVKIVTPVTKEPGGETKIEEIPLPPEHLWSELDNSGKAAATVKAGPPAEPAAAAPTPVREIAQLEFSGAKLPSKLIPLEYGFTFDGAKVTSVTVRRLSIGAVGDLIDSLPPGRIDNFDIYAAMTGLPAPVLRGLIDIDGERVTEACYDFLPRVFRPAAPPPAPGSS